jgi:hypothetical protein
MTDMDTANTAMNQMGEEEGGEDESEEEGKVVSASVIAWHYSVLTLLDYMGRRVRIQ